MVLSVKMKDRAKVLPSLLSAPFMNLGEVLLKLEKAGADLFHFDVMDGHFVPNLTMGPLLIESIQPYLKSQFDVHLMVDNPDDHIRWFDFDSVRSLSIHVETKMNVRDVLSMIRGRGKMPGIVLNPATDVHDVDIFLEQVDLVLVMTVHPGFGGQTLLPEVLPKIQWLRERREECGMDYAIQVDGGVNVDTIRLVRQAGADEIVMGHAIFDQPDPVAAYHQLNHMIKEYRPLPVV